MKRLLFPLSLLLLLGSVFGTEDNDPEHPRVATSSIEFLSDLPDVKALKEFDRGAETPGFGANSDQDFQKLIGEINAKNPVDSVGIGDAQTEYDVILQPGHYQRTSGRTGTQGKYVSEQALVAYITNIVAGGLRRTGEKVLVVSADKYLRPTRTGADFNGLRSKVFLAIHADGSDKPCTTGPSLGYQRPTAPLAMHMIGLGLADALGYDYTSFRRDNFTANEAKYYMFSQVKSGRLTGLLEVGELTCEKSERELVSSSHAIAANVARAIDFILRTPQGAAHLGTREAPQLFVSPQEVEAHGESRSTVVYRVEE